MTADNSIVRVYRVAVRFDGLFLFKEQKKECGEVCLESQNTEKKA
jgi:hypothetical protein